MRFQFRDLMDSLPADGMEMSPLCKKTKHKPCVKTKGEEGDKTVDRGCRFTVDVGDPTDSPPCRKTLTDKCPAATCSPNSVKASARCPKEARANLDLLRSQLRQTLEQAGL